jgi:predicted choloylglycine hydrolase
MLSLYRPPPYLTGCTQAVWTRGAPFLARNYDYHPDACEGVFLKSCWHGTRVIAASECLWGALDGMNEHGLAIALSFGGNRLVGAGFGIPLILRYVLEFCTTLEEAAEVLARVPSHMTYSVSLLDRSGAFGVAYLRPDRETRLVRERVTTNHQDRIEWKEYADLTRSQERKEFLLRKLRSKGVTHEAALDLFLDPPLHVTDYSRGHGTLYTVAYRPRDGSADYMWPGYRTRRTFDEFTESEIVVPLIGAAPVGAALSPGAS